MSEKTISNKTQLREWLKYERALYEIKISDIILLNENYIIWKFIKALRYCEYYRNSKKKILLPLFVLTRRKKNRMGAKLGFFVSENCIGKGLLIYHYGNVVINGNAIIGENVRLHGQNCIGNDGINDECPVIGNNVDLGVGVSVIGKCQIADNVKIGANATVVKDCLEKGATYVGTPAKKV